VRLEQRNDAIINAGADRTRRDEKRFALEVGQGHGRILCEAMGRRHREHQPLVRQWTDHEPRCRKGRMQHAEVDLACLERRFERRGVHLDELDCDIGISASKKAHRFRQHAVEGDHGEAEAQPPDLPAHGT
jgi:hypothetical protein